MRVVLGTGDWGPTNNMYYTTLREATAVTSFTSGKSLTTPQHEAKGILVWANNMEKWIKQAAWMEKNQGKKLPIKGGKYTATDSGQNEYTAWSDEGLQLYKDTKKKVKEAWGEEHQDKIMALEKKTLAALRQKNGLRCETHEEEQKLNKKNKRRQKNNMEEVAAKKPKFTSLIDDDDEEEE